MFKKLIIVFYACLGTEENLWNFINNNSQTLILALIVIVLIIIFGFIYVAFLCYALHGKLDFVYDQESGQPLNVIQIQGCCCCKRKKATGET